MDCVVSPANGPWLSGGGETGYLLRTRDWGSTPLRALDTWPRTLRSAVRLMLSWPVPCCVFWGPQLYQLYNDHYIPIAADRHPAILGRPAWHGWPELRPILEPRMHRVLAGSMVVDRDIQMTINGEERYFSWAFAPLHNDAGECYGSIFLGHETTLGVRARLKRQEEERKKQQLQDALQNYGSATCATDSVSTDSKWNGSDAMDDRSFSVDSLPPSDSSNLDSSASTQSLLQWDSELPSSFASTNDLPSSFASSAHQQLPPHSLSSSSTVSSSSLASSRSLSLEPLFPWGLLSTEDH